MCETSSYSSRTGAGHIGPRDRELWERARDLIPWRTQTNAKRRPDALADVMPGFITRGEGCRIWDPDGRMFLDYDLSLGPVILGYSYPDVVEAVRRQMDHGVLFPMASPLEIEVAEHIRELVPCAERVRFLKTGADANAACIRLARVVTGRDMIVTTGYHGWSDVFMPGQAGVPDSVSALTIPCDFGDVEAGLYGETENIRSIVTDDFEVVALEVKTPGRFPALPRDRTIPCLYEFEPAVLVQWYDELA